MHRRTKAILVVRDWNGEETPMADAVSISDRPTHSDLLGPDGNPLRYETIKFGFQPTRPKKQR